MKRLEFETSKGRFLLIDSEDAPSSFNRYLRDIEEKLDVQLTIGYKLSEISEEEASEIVDEDNEYGVRIFQNYQTTSMQYFDEQITAIESLHSLLKSKGIHLFENPYKNHQDKDLETWYEELTFYNPYIFKL